MKLTFTLCLLLFCVGLSVVTEAKRTTKSKSYSSTKTFYSSSKQDNDDRTYCELLDLPQVCTLEYVPVCAHIRDCEGDSCFETAGNVCAACKDGKYDYFVQGECPGGSQNEEESVAEEESDDKLYCELLDLPQVCPQVWDPVCAHIRGCEGNSCYGTIGNGCIACGSEGKYDYFVQGECSGDCSEEYQNEEESSGTDEIRCELVDIPEVCPLIYDPVCAHLRDCEGDSCYETVGNGCQACGSEGKYDSFVSGECPEVVPETDLILCELVDIPEVCPLIYDPVCAYIRDCEGGSCYETVGNGCQACGSEGKYYSYVPGECAGGSENEEESSTDETRCELVDIPEVCPLIYDPVCAHLRDCEGDSCHETVGNGCQACGSEGKYDSFVPGECPTDRLYCELLDVTEVCPQIYDPVCAHLRDCEGDSCSETVGNGCTACSSEGKYDYFVQGECSGGSENEEESGTDETNCDLVDIPEVCPQIYDPVCAHRRGCKGDYCHETIGNGCTACSSGGAYDTFVPGKCEPQSKRKYCDDDNRPDFCTKEYFPVCAHHEDDSFSTAGNKCMACAESDVDYYTLGAC